MRLLHARTLKFQDFNESALPPYAILSHTWKAGEEVTFQDLSSPYLPAKQGYGKITEMCRVALTHGLEFAWVDTCCIDKTSSAELNESINSMFRWYKKARICFVYLSDMNAASMAARTELARCAWFTRGWTLQELLAPVNVEFYNSQWTCIGTRERFAEELSTITGIPVTAISGRFPPGSFSVAQRMSWAAKRVTSRPEDIAYCLLGLFDVHIPLIYGEGSKAFIRLQEEVAKRTRDMTLFAWKPQSPCLPYCSALASAPLEFAGSGEVVAGPYADDSEYSFTNKGVQVTARPCFEPLSPTQPGLWSTRQAYRSVLLLGRIQCSTNRDIQHIGIYINMIGPGRFVRETQPLLFDKTTDLVLERTQTFQLLLLSEGQIETNHHTLLKGIHIPSYDNITMMRGFPHTYWDVRNQICYSPHSCNEVIVFPFEACCRGRSFYFGVLFRFTRGSEDPECRVIDKRISSSKWLFLLSARNLEEPMKWATIEDELPEIMELTDRLRMEVGGIVFQITCSFGKKVVEIDSQPIKLRSLDIKVSEVPNSSRLVAKEHFVKVDNQGLL